MFDQEITLVSRTQPSGPLCLWQCFMLKDEAVERLNERNALYAQRLNMTICDENADFNLGLECDN